jgi:integrase
MTWWFKFRFEGQVIRESANTESKTLAREAERSRRRQLEGAINGLSRSKRPTLFPLAVDAWLENLSAALRPHTVENYRIYAGRLKRRFQNRLVVDFDERVIADMQRELTAAGFAPRTVNLHLAILRMILRHAGAWSLTGRVRMLRERHDVGREITSADEVSLLNACAKSRNPALLPLFTLALDTGLRASELRGLRHSDLKLAWEGEAIVSGALTVSKSKTAGGEGRIVPLTRRAHAVLTLWISRFPQAQPCHYVFSAFKISFTGNDRRFGLYGIDPGRSAGSWKKAWGEACRTARARYRWHYCRHTFISRLGSNPRLVKAPSRRSPDTSARLCPNITVTFVPTLKNRLSGVSRASIWK